MGKFDSILKHLGKENFESPDIIERALNEIEPETQDNILDDDNLANIDHLLNLPEFRSNDPENDNTVSEVESVTETSEKSPASSPQEEYPEGLDPEVIKEFEHLNSPPPDINALLKKFEEKNQDIVNDFMEENEQAEDSFEFQDEFEISDNVETGFDDTFQEDLSEEPLSADSESGREIEDLLSQFSPEEESPAISNADQPADINSLLNAIGGESEISTPPEPEEIKPKIPQDLTADDTSDLSDLLEQAKKEFPQTPTPHEEASIPMEESNELGILPETDHNLDLGIETPQDLPELDTSFSSEDLGDIDSLSIEAESDFPTDSSSDLNLEDTNSNFSTSSDQTDFAETEDTAVLAQREALAHIALDEHKILNIRNRINQISDPELRKKVRKILIDGRLSVDLLEQLIAKLLLNENTETLNIFIKEVAPDLEAELLSEQIPEQEDFAPAIPTKRVLYAEDARKAQEFEEELKKIAKYALVLFGTLILLGLIFYRIIWMPSNANRYYKKGLRALRSGQFIEAEANFTIATRKSEPNLNWYNRYAQAYEKLKKIKSAEKKYMAALRIDPLNEKTIYNAANLYINHYPYQFDKAIDLYSRIRKKHPKNFSIVDLIGTTYMKWGDHTKDSSLKAKYYNAANNIYNDYLIKKPKHLSSYFRQLQIALKFGDASNIKLYDDIILHINKNAINLEIMTELAKYYVNQRNLARAKKTFDRLINYTQKIISDQMKSKLPLSDLNTMYPPLSEAYYQYARFLSINIDFVKAIDILGLTTKINPRHGRAYNLLGEIYSVQENMPQHIQLAKENFEKSIQYTPGYYRPYANLGHIYYYDKLDIQNSSNPIGLMGSRNSEQNLSRALFYYESAKSRLPKNAKDFLLQFNLAWLYYHYQNYLYAFKEWSTLYVDEPYNPVLSYALANTYFHMNKLSLSRIQYDKAIEYYSAIAKRMGYINPELDRHKEIYTQLARSYNNRGVINTVLASDSKKSHSKYQQQALLDFYLAKDEAHQINLIYDKAEVNIKTILNQSIKGRKSSFDENIPERTSLQNWIDEFREKMIKNL